MAGGFQPRRTSTATAPRGPVSPLVPEIVSDPNTALTSPGAIESMTRGEVDIQISTAKRYPRDVVKFLNELEALATRDAETAEACFYTLKRKDRESGGEKKIQGPSIRFAELLVACWGSMRVAGSIVAQDARFVTLRGMAWDLERNTAIATEVQRRITGRNGNTYSDDMIGVTANAGTSIAIRNAVIHAIPGAFWKPVYEKCLDVARGDAKTLSARWAKVIEFFKVRYGKEPEDVYGYLGITGPEQVTLDHLEDMQGLRTALKDGDVTIDEAFADVTPSAKSKSPVDVIAEALGVDATFAAAVHDGFEKLALPPAARTVQLRGHKDDPRKLLVTLCEMAELPLPDWFSTEASTTAAPATSESKTEARTETTAAPAPQQSSKSAAPAASSKQRFGF